MHENEHLAFCQVDVFPQARMAVDPKLWSAQITQITQIVGIGIFTVGVLVLVFTCKLVWTPSPLKAEKQCFSMFRGFEVQNQVLTHQNPRVQHTLTHNS